MVDLLSLGQNKRSKDFRDFNVLYRQRKPTLQNVYSKERGSTRWICQLIINLKVDIGKVIIASTVKVVRKTSFISDNHSYLHDVFSQERGTEWICQLIINLKGVIGKALKASRMKLIRKTSFISDNHQTDQTRWQ